ncbi:hypothetical protein [Enterobacter ludwigii]|uniref:hypothetical protein n=1 Tax=Enterobacter ludwigii TaxID=299767 RepID=UPI0039761EF7
MLLNRLFSLFFIIVATGCQGFNFDAYDKNDYVVVNVNQNIDDRMLQKLEQIMTVEMPFGFTDVAIYTDSKNSQEASKLNAYFNKMYGLSSSVYLDSSDEALYIQFKKYRTENCYKYELNDFNWYKSNTYYIEKYNRAEVCATSLNDNTLKA